MSLNPDNNNNSSSKPLVSVITPALNCEATIAECVESVLSQTYPNIEHVIVDGGSTDSTFRVLREYEKLYPERIRIINQDGKGIYNANNIGIANSRGKIVGFLNGDDFFSSSNIVQFITDQLQINKAEAVYGDVRYIGRLRKRHTIRYYSSANFAPPRMLRGFMPAHPTFYCYRSLYETFGYYNENFQLSGDFELMLRMIYKGGIKTHYINRECVVMRWGGRSTRISNIPLVIREHAQAYRINGLKTTMLADLSRYAEKLLEFLHFI